MSSDINPEIRKKAAERLDTPLPPFSKEQHDNSSAETLLQELQIHHAELELQNEELIQSRTDLERITERYFQYFDMAPIGILCLSDTGEILECNFEAAEMLSITRMDISKRNPSFQNFLEQESQHHWRQAFQRALSEPAKQTIEVSFNSHDGPMRRIRLQMSSREGITTINNRRTRTVVLYLIDVSDLAQANHDLRIEQTISQRLALVAAHSNDPIFLCNANGHIIWANQPALTLTGHTQPIGIGKSIASVLPPAEDSISIEALLNKAHKQNQQIKEDIKLLIDDQPRWFDLKINPVNDPHLRHGVEIILTLEDIHARKTFITQLANFKKAVDQNPCSVIITNDRGQIEYVNPCFSQKTGYTREEAIGLNLRILKSGYHSEAFYSEIWATLARGEIWRGEILNRKKNGQLFWEQASISPIHDREGTVTHYVAIKEDISDRKAAEEQIRMLSMVASRTSNGVMIFDPYGKIIWVNESLSRITGWSIEEIIGKPYTIFHGTQTDVTIIRNIAASIQEGQSIEEELILYHKDGSTRWVKVQIDPILSPNGKVEKFFAISTDIHQQKILQESLTIARDEAREAAKAKSEFLAVMSHEIRTPLNAVVGFASLLEEAETLSPEQKESLKIIQRNADALTNIITDILDFSRIEAGSVRLENIPFSLKTLLLDLEKTHNPTASKKGISLILEWDDKIPAEVFGDPTRIRQVLTNLVSNALKFTEKGHIKIKAVLLAHTDNDGLHISFSVQDTGIGISPDQAAILFRPFTQADSSTTRKFGGTGLGLAICKRLVNAMGGNISLESEIGTGSRFTFDLWLG